MLYLGFMSSHHFVSSASEMVSQNVLGKMLIGGIYTASISAYLWSAFKSIPHQIAGLRERLRQLDAVEARIVDPMERALFFQHHPVVRARIAVEIQAELTAFCATGFGSIIEEVHPDLLAYREGLISRARELESLGTDGVLTTALAEVEALGTQTPDNNDSEVRS